MRVHEPGNDRRAGHVDHPGALGHRAPRPDAGDPVVADHDVGVLDHLGPTHRDRAGATQHDCALRDVARGAHPHAHLLGAVSGIDGGAVQPERGERVADGPVDRAPVRAPGGELAADVGQPGDRERRAVGLGDHHGRHLTAHQRNGNHVNVAVGERECEIAPRRHHHEAGGSLRHCFAREVPRHREVGRVRNLVGAGPDGDPPRDPQVGLQVGVVPAGRDEGHRRWLAGLESGIGDDTVAVDPLGIAGEMRTRAAPGRAHHSDVAPVGRDPDELGSQAAAYERVNGFLEVSRVGADRHDPPPVRRPRR